MTDLPHLTKTLFQSGLACPKRLWWEVHEPDAPELSPDAQTQWMFRQGQEVTLAARPWVPDALPEVTLEAKSLHARVDLLEPLNDATHRLIEVKGSNEVKREHLWDVAFQRHVAVLAEVEVTQAEVMHLNKACHNPDLDVLFLRQDVLAQSDPFLAQVPDTADLLLDMLEGTLPGDSRNANCGDCPFHDRCWPRDRFSVSHFYRMNWQQKLELEREGHEIFTSLPPGRKLTSIQRRQQRSAAVGAMVVDPSLGAALSKWTGPLVYLDFETVAFAIPRFAGTGPWARIPVQYSVHREEGEGHVHRAFLAQDGDDPRPALAAQLVRDCAGEGGVVTYHSSFEKGCLRGLAEAVPQLATELKQIHDRVVDLEPMVAHHLYHPDFKGSFSLKVVLPTLCPELSYEGLPIADGGTAQFEIARMLYGRDPLPDAEWDSLRSALLAYCERDTWAMVALHRRLRELAATVG